MPIAHASCRLCGDTVHCLDVINFIGAAARLLGNPRCPLCLEATQLHPGVVAFVSNPTCTGCLVSVVRGNDVANWELAWERLFPDDVPDEWFTTRELLEGAYDVVCGDNPTNVERLSIRAWRFPEVPWPRSHHPFLVISRAPLPSQALRRPTATVGRAAQTTFVLPADSLLCRCNTCERFVR